VTAASSIIFVGESPPADAPDDFAPFDCASGTRLATILGLRDRATLLAHVPRDNLFPRPTGIGGDSPAWNFERSLAGADDVIERAEDGATIVALGRRVADAFLIRSPIPGLAPAIGSTWTINQMRDSASNHPRAVASWAAMSTRCIYVPHPSGASTVYTAEVKRDVRQMLLPEMILGLPSLRPWHFRLDDPPVLHDLAAAVSPLCPALGAAALIWADGQHKARAARQSTPLLSRLHAATSAFGAAAHAFAEKVANEVRADKSPPWDTPLIDIVRAAIRHDGARILGAAWDPARVATKAGRAGWLVTLAKQYVALNNYQRHIIRAHMTRYAQGNIA